MESYRKIILYKTPEKLQMILFPYLSKANVEVKKCNDDIALRVILN